MALFLAGLLIGLLIGALAPVGVSWLKNWIATR